MMYSAPCLLADISINWNTQLKIILKISYFFNFWFIFFNGMTDVSPPFIHSAGWPIPSSYVHAWLLSHVPTPCDSVDCNQPGSSVHGDSPGKNTGVVCHSLLQGFLPAQGSNPGFLHFRWILYHLSHQGSLFHLHAPPPLIFTAF